MMLGDLSAEEDQVVILAVPAGDAGPAVAMPIKTKWLIGKFGQFGGEYSVVAQVDRILGEGEELPALRLTHDVAATQVEIAALKESIAGFKAPAEGMGVEISDGDAVIEGP